MGVVDRRGLRDPLECLCGGDARVPRQVAGCEGGGSAGAGDAVDEDPFTFGTQSDDRVDGAVEDAPEVWLRVLPDLVHQPDLMVLDPGRDLLGPNPTQRHDSVDLADRVTE